MIYLQMLTIDKQFDPVMAYKPFNPDDYYIASVVPKAETENIIDTARWYIQRSAEAEWLRSKTRVIKAGDVIQDGEDVWMFYPADMSADELSIIPKTTPVVQLANLNLVRLELKPEDSGRMWDGESSSFS